MANTSSVASTITDLMRHYLYPDQPAKQGETAEQTRGLHQLVRDKLNSHPESAATLQNFEQNPDQHAEVMKNTLNQHLSNDPSFMDQAVSKLQGILAGAGREGSQGGESFADKARGTISGLFGEKKDQGGQKAA